MEFSAVAPDAKVGARAMLERDHASAALGMKLIDFAPGSATVVMPIRRDMLNGFECVHGGIMFALADTTFAIACNDDESVTLASGAEITYLRPVRLGQVLTATAKEVARQGRSGIYDVSLKDETGQIVAEFRGHSRLTNLPFPRLDQQPSGSTHEAANVLPTT
jgi:acyl-CoA thioesterase